MKSMLWMTALALVTACATPASFMNNRPVVIGMVAKSADNPVFIAARVGAEEAARAWARTRGREIRIEWRTPARENAAEQAQAVTALADQGVAGILLSCSNDQVLTPAIDAAVARGVPVLCFDADAPQSRRFAFYGCDNFKAGEELARLLVPLLKREGRVAVLCGNKEAPNLQARLAGVRAELKKHPRLTIVAEIHHVETPAAAVAALAAAQKTHPDIDGWIMIGGWPFFAGAPAWNSGRAKVVSMDALPEQLARLEDGTIETLLAQRCHSWGYRGVELLLKRVIDNRAPVAPFMIDELQVVRKADVAEFRAKWESWLGARRNR